MKSSNFIHNWTFLRSQNEEAPAQMLENVAFFCESGGLDTIKDCFDSDKSEMPITLASCFISIIAQVSALQSYCYLSFTGFLKSLIL